MSSPPAYADLQRRIPLVMLREQQSLRRRLDSARRTSDQGRRDRALAATVRALDAAEARLERRRAAVPEISYPAQLPVSQRADDLRTAIREHQVVVVAGETGSGKTTQLPKICLELGRGVQGTIGHTQPRRIAARTVAERISEELGVELGTAIGYQVRFTERVTDRTLVKVMTDGILLAEIQHDPMLRGYDTLIVDEAHERSLNIDFILGYLKRLLPRRPDLKVILTSATIDPERFAAHFDDAPIVEVSGRTFPVEVRYRPMAQQSENAGNNNGASNSAERSEPRDLPQAVCDAVAELQAEAPGDVLVFLSGEREIRDTADAVRGMRLRDTEVLPLYSRLSAAEQHKVFTAHSGRRVVLATNVAETSLTVPGIRYVVDPGTARISRYSHRTKVQRLPIEAISQASARQRAGRCGRLSDGICIRLYAEDDFEARPAFTEPEILRTNLASVILQMAALGLAAAGDGAGIADFPFLDPPDRRQIADGVALLEELGALETATGGGLTLTPVGRKLATIPIDPRLGRMILAAGDHNCLREILIITAALSIQDPRERPADMQQQADERHRRFADETSDFLSFLNLWNYLRDEQRSRTSSAFRRMCRSEFLNYLRVREWQDLEGQLRQAARSLSLTRNDTAADGTDVHKSLLAGLLSHIGMKEGDSREYLGARGARFMVFPGSALAKKPPQFAMAAELVETSRLWARVVARIDPEWAETLAPQLVRRSYSEPRWERKRGAVVATEKVTLYGVPIVAARTVLYGNIDPELSRELFIRNALVEGDWETRHHFFTRNKDRLDEVVALEERSRRRDIVVDDETLFHFYDARVGADVVSGRHFDTWWKRTRREQPELLDFPASLLVNATAGVISEQDYPDGWEYDDLRLPLAYRFEPGAPADGVTVEVPLGVLNRISAEPFQWQVPGFREAMVITLIRALPKDVRRELAPAPDRARALLARVGPADGALLPALRAELRDTTGIDIPAEAWSLDLLPPHLRMTFRVRGDNGDVVGEGKDLEALRAQLAQPMRAVVAAAGTGLERTGAQRWDFGTLPRTVSSDRDGHAVQGFPALVDEGASVGVQVLPTAGAARVSMWLGTRRLLLLALPSPSRQLQRGLSNHDKLALRHNPYGDLAALLAECIACAVDALIIEHGGVAHDEAGFTTLLDHARARLPQTAAYVLEWTGRILGTAAELDRSLAATGMPAGSPSITDIRNQRNALVYKGFLTGTGMRRLPDVHRYLLAAQQRLAKLPADPRRDEARMRDVQAVLAAYQAARAEVAGGRSGPSPTVLRDVGWMIEELRVSYFAQQLGTAYPVSPQRIYRALAEIGD